MPVFGFRNAASYQAFNQLLRARGVSDFPVSGVKIGGKVASRQRLRQLSGKGDTPRGILGTAVQIISGARAKQRGPGGDSPFLSARMWRLRKMFRPRGGLYE